MFLERELNGETRLSVLLPAITRQVQPVDIFHFYDWLGTHSELAFVLISDGERCALAQIPKSEVPNLNIPDLVRFGAIEYTGVRTDIPKFNSQAVRSFIKHVNGKSILLQASKIHFRGRGPVLTHFTVPRFTDLSLLSTLEDFQEDSNDVSVIPHKFMGERPRRFQRVDGDCLIM